MKFKTHVRKELSRDIVHVAGSEADVAITFAKRHRDLGWDEIAAMIGPQILPWACHASSTSQPKRR